MKRRAFITSLGAASLLTMGVPRLYALPQNSPRLLLVFLRGAYDCNNILVPYKSEFYYESRPNLAIHLENGSGQAGAVALDDTWALAPSVHRSLLPLWKAKQLAFVPFAGTTDMSRSHFKTQASIEAGLPGIDHAAGDSGFLARLAATLSGVHPISFTNTMPAIFRGSQTIPNISLKESVRKTGMDTHQAKILADMYGDTTQGSAVEEGIALQQQISHDLKMEMEKSGQGAINTDVFEQEARRIARLMKSKFRLAFVDVGGWDTHVNQGAESGNLAKKLSKLGGGLSAYAQELDSEWKNTVVVVISEFGRTFRENGNNGTDHGHGTVYWILGGSINGGKILGEQVQVRKETLLQNRDYQVLTTYQNLLGGIFQKMWGLNTQQVQSIFTGFSSGKIQIV